MIPEMVDIGAAWEVLEPGIHDATLGEVEKSFSTNEKRRALYRGLVQGCQALRRAGCSTVFLDGSYVTAKPHPGDFDVCWDPIGVNVNLLDPVLLDFSNARRNQKIKYGGEFFPSTAGADASRTFVEYFQNDTDTGNKKGVLRIHL